MATQFPTASSPVAAYPSPVTPQGQAFDPNVASAIPAFDPTGASATPAFDPNSFATPPSPATAPLGIGPATAGQPDISALMAQLGQPTQSGSIPTGPPTEAANNIVSYGQSAGQPAAGQALNYQA